MGSVMSYNYEYGDSKTTTFPFLTDEQQIVISDIRCHSESLSKLVSDQEHFAEKVQREFECKERQLKEKDDIIRSLQGSNVNHKESQARLEARERQVRENEKQIEIYKTKCETWQKTIESRDRELKEKEAQLNTEYGHWSKSLESKDKSLKDKELQVSSLKARYDNALKSLENRERELKDSELEITQLRAKMQAQAKGKEEELRQLRAKVAKLSEDKVCRDQRTVENISSANRPSDVQATCRGFFAGERMDAMEIIEKYRLVSKKSVADNSLYIQDSRIACFIFEMAHSEAYTAAQYFQKALPHIFHCAYHVGYVFSRDVQSRDKKITFIDIDHDNSDAARLPSTLEDCTKMLLKERADTCNTNELVEKISKRLSSRASEVKLSKYQRKITSDLKLYISQCARLAWKMVTQTPPILIQTDEKNGKAIIFDPKLHEKCRGTPTTYGKGHVFVKSILWPAMYEEGSGRIISRGEVELQ